MKMFALGAAVAAAVAVAAPAAEAQDYTLPPNYGGVALTSGFLPDPHTITLTAGGGFRASFQNGCAANITQAPDYRLQYSAGSLPLSIYVRAPADTVLIVNGPDTSWYCVDDYNGLDPAVYFTNPLSGQYDIWVGTYGSNTIPGARLYISEFQPFQY